MVTYYQTTNDKRQEIIQAVETYFRWQPAESSAPFVSDALEYLDALEKAGKLFWRSLLESSYTELNDQTQRDAILYVQNTLGRYMKKYDPRGQADWRDLQEIMQTCIAAFTATRSYLTSPGNLGFIEGSAWDFLTWELFNIANRSNLPTGAGKLGDPNKASPFVAFVRELQLRFPKQYRRHETSNAALTEAISVARRRYKAAIKERIEG